MFLAQLELFMLCSLWTQPMSWFKESRSRWEKQKSTNLRDCSEPALAVCLVQPGTMSWALYWGNPLRVLHRLCVTNFDPDCVNASEEHSSVLIADLCFIIVLRYLYYKDHTQIVLGVCFGISEWLAIANFDENFVQAGKHHWPTIVLWQFCRCTLGLQAVVIGSTF